jgi:hypothetical protein
VTESRAGQTFLLRIFYASLFVTLGYQIQAIVNLKTGFASGQLMGFASLFERWAVGRPAFNVFVMLFFVLALGAVLWRPLSWVTRFIAAIAYHLAVSSVFSLYGGAWNAFHHSAVACVLLIFLRGRPEFDRMVFRLCQAAILSHYFMSGFWKLSKTLTFPSFKDFLTGFWFIPYNAVAAALGEGNGPVPVVLDVIIKYPVILIFGWIFVLTFQCGAFFPVFSPRWVRVWGVGALVFHLATGFFLDIWFAEAMIADAFFLLLYEDWIRLGNTEPAA